MSRSASRRWMAACLLGIAAWIGVTVLAGALADDPTDPKPTLIAFAAGGTAYFGAIFGYSLWRTRRRRSERIWDGVDVAADGEAITVRREGHESPAWLWDLWLAERLAGAGG